MDLNNGTMLVLEVCDFGRLVDIRFFNGFQILFGYEFENDSYCISAYDFHMPEPLQEEYAHLDPVAARAKLDKLFHHYFEQSQCRGFSV